MWLALTRGGWGREVRYLARHQGGVGVRDGVPARRQKYWYRHLKMHVNLSQSRVLIMMIMYVTEVVGSYMLEYSVQAATEKKMEAQVPSSCPPNCARGDAPRMCPGTPGKHT